MALWLQVAIFVVYWISVWSQSGPDTSNNFLPIYKAIPTSHEPIYSHHSKFPSDYTPSKATAPESHHPISTVIHKTQPLSIIIDPSTPIYQPKPPRVYNFDIHKPTASYDIHNHGVKINDNVYRVQPVKEISESYHQLKPEIKPYHDHNHEVTPKKLAYHETKHEFKKPESNSYDDVKHDFKMFETISYFEPKPEQKPHQEGKHVIKQKHKSHHELKHAIKLERKPSHEPKQVFKPEHKLYHDPKHAFKQEHKPKNLFKPEHKPHEEAKHAFKLKHEPKPVIKPKHKPYPEPKHVFKSEHKPHHEPKPVFKSQHKPYLEPKIAFKPEPKLHHKPQHDLKSEQKPYPVIKQEQRPHHESKHAFKPHYKTTYESKPEIKSHHKQKHHSSINKNHHSPRYESKLGTNVAHEPKHEIKAESRTNDHHDLKSINKPKHITKSEKKPFYEFTYTLEPNHEEAKPYAFDYGVTDEYSGTNFGHTETSNGKEVKGSYTVALPDGRIQKVAYTADDYNGFQAQVTYEGEAKYPKYVRHYNADAIHPHRESVAPRQHKTQIEFGVQAKSFQHNQSIGSHSNKRPLQEHISPFTPTQVVYTAPYL